MSFRGTKQVISSYISPFQIVLNEKESPDFPSFSDLEPPMIEGYRVQYANEIKTSHFLRVDRSTGNDILTTYTTVVWCFVSV